MSIDDEALARLRSLLAKATPGPWSLSGAGFVLSSERHCIGDGVYGPDATLIVAMRKDIEALLDIAEAVARAPVETMHHLGGGTLAAELVLPDVWTALDGERVALVIVPCTGGAE